MIDRLQDLQVPDERFPVTLSDMIDRLTNLRDQHGDLPVEISMNGGEYGQRLDTDDLSDIGLYNGHDHDVILLDW
jgi:hypothetical protein